MLNSSYSRARTLAYTHIQHIHTHTHSHTGTHKYTLTRCRVLTCNNHERPSRDLCSISGNRPRPRLCRLHLTCFLLLNRRRFIFVRLFRFSLHSITYCLTKKVTCYATARLYEYEIKSHCWFCNICNFFSPTFEEVLRGRTVKCWYSFSGIKRM